MLYMHLNILNVFSCRTRLFKHFSKCLERVILWCTLSSSLFCIGNRTYVGYVYMECTQNSPVLHAFIGVLRAAVKQRVDNHRLRDECQDNEEGMEPYMHVCNKRN